MTEALVQFAQKAVILDNGKLLLIKKWKGDPHNPGRWELPGGRLQAGELVDMALYREVREEVGLEVEPGRPLALWEFRLNSDRGLVVVVVVVVARHCVAKSSFVTLDSGSGGEAASYAWVDPYEVADYDLIPSSRVAMEQIVKIIINGL